MRDKQYEIVLQMLRRGSVTTKDIIENYILAPQAVIRDLRAMGYKILTEQVAGQKYKKYTLIPTAKQGRLF